MSATSGASTDWGALVRVRERRLEAAGEACARARRSAGEAALMLERANAAHAQWVALCGDHARQMRNHGACQAGALTEGCGLARRLDARLAQARRQEQLARECCAAARLALAAQLRTLRSAAAELRAAQEMQRRHRQALSRRREHRAADQLDDTAGQRWLRAPRHRM